MDDYRAHQVRLSLAGLEALSILPCVAGRIYRPLAGTAWDPGEVASIVEFSPELAARVLAWASKAGDDPAGSSLGQILQRMPQAEVQQLLLEAPLCGSIGQSQPEPGAPAVTRADLILHCVAAAYAAQCLAEEAFDGVNPNTAYLAGLLHDIGKFAVQDVMPKGFARLVTLAAASGQSLWRIEREQLGLDHSALGADLAERWHLGRLIHGAIWLHHAHAKAILGLERSLGQVVAATALANHLAKRSPGRPSGGFSPLLGIPDLARAFQVDAEVLQDIQGQVDEYMRDAPDRLGLSSRDTDWMDLAQSARSLAISLDQRHAAAAKEGVQLRHAAGLVDVVKDLCAALRPGQRAVDTAECCARLWQRSFQTGKVCIYLVGEDDAEVIEAVLIEDLGRARQVLLHSPEAGSTLAAVWRGQVEIRHAGPDLAWIAPQLTDPEVRWDSSRTHWMPLIAAGKALGGILFESHYPADATTFRESLSLVCRWMGSLIGMALTHQASEAVGLRLAAALADLDEDAQTEDQGRFVEGLTEMAAGFAHELNNPLSVICGRAELLEQDETDAVKKTALHQIRDHGRGASLIVEDLLAFAQPQPPRRVSTSVHQIVEEAVQLTRHRLGHDLTDVEIRVPDSTPPVEVDSGQMASALSNCLMNAVQAYEGRSGPASVRVTAHAMGERVILSIEDHGTGMDRDTLRKASYPFFSSKPAGRQTGMGLTHAARLVSINCGTLSVRSLAGQGTLVMICLPCH